MRFKHFLPVIVIALVFWPWLGNPLAHTHWGDRFRSSIPFALALGGAPCERYDEDEELLVIGRGPDCYRYEDPRVFNGIWRNEFEGSSFYEGRTSLPENYVVHREAWLNLSEEALANPEIRLLYDSRPAVIQINFVGRRTAHRGSHGHLGLWPHDIIVDEVINYHIIGPPAS